MCVTVSLTGGRGQRCTRPTDRPCRRRPTPARPAPHHSHGSEPFAHSGPARAPAPSPVVLHRTCSTAPPTRARPGPPPGGPAAVRPPPEARPPAGAGPASKDGQAGRRGRGGRGGGRVAGQQSERGQASASGGATACAPARRPLPPPTQPRALCLSQTAPLPTRDRVPPGGPRGLGVSGLQGGPVPGGWMGLGRAAHQRFKLPAVQPVAQRGEAAQCGHHAAGGA